MNYIRKESNKMKQYNPPEVEVVKIDLDDKLFNPNTDIGVGGGSSYNEEGA